MDRFVELYPLYMQDAAHPSAQRAYLVKCPYRNQASIECFWGIDHRFGSLLKEMAGPRCGVALDTLRSHQGRDQYILVHVQRALFEPTIAIVITTRNS